MQANEILIFSHCRSSFLLKIKTINLKTSLVNKNNAFYDLRKYSN